MAVVVKTDHRHLLFPLFSSAIPYDLVPALRPSCLARIRTIPTIPDVEEE